MADDLLTRIRAWREDDNARYAQAIELLCEAETALASGRQARERAESQLAAQQETIQRLTAENDRLMRRPIPVLRLGDIRVPPCWNCRHLEESLEGCGLYCRKGDHSAQYGDFSCSEPRKVQL